MALGWSEIGDFQQYRTIDDFMRALELARRRGARMTWWSARWRKPTRRRSTSPLHAEGRNARSTRPTRRHWPNGCPAPANAARPWMRSRPPRRCFRPNADANGTWAWIADFSPNADRGNCQLHKQYTSHFASCWERLAYWYWPIRLCHSLGR